MLSRAATCAATLAHFLPSVLPSFLPSFTCSFPLAAGGRPANAIVAANLARNVAHRPVQQCSAWILRRRVAWWLVYTSEGGPGGVPRSGFGVSFAVAASAGSGGAAQRGRNEMYTWPGSNWRPSACGADVIATRPQVLRVDARLLGWSCFGLLGLQLACVRPQAGDGLGIPGGRLLPR